MMMMMRAQKSPLKSLKNWYGVDKPLYFYGIGEIFVHVKSLVGVKFWSSWRVAEQISKSPSRRGRQ